jgi:hypothetical protein
MNEAPTTARPLAFELLSSTDLGDTTVTVVEQAFAGRKWAWTIVSTAAGADVLVMPTGLVRRVDMIEPGTTSAAVIEFVINGAAEPETVAERTARRQGFLDSMRGR